MVKAKDPYTEATTTGPNNKLPSFPSHNNKNDFDDHQEVADTHGKMLAFYNVKQGGKRRRRKSRKKKHRRSRRQRSRRKRQRGGQKGKYGKPGIGSEDSLCGSFQTPEEMKFTPDKYIVVPQPSGSTGGALSTNETTMSLAKVLTQARANSEGDFGVVDSVFQDDREDIGDAKIPKGGRRRRKSRRRRRRRKRRKSRKKKHRRRRRRGSRRR
jgi:hypothetical protein